MLCGTHRDKALERLNERVEQLEAKLSDKAKRVQELEQAAAREAARVEEERHEAMKRERALTLETRKKVNILEETIVKMQMDHTMELAMASGAGGTEDAGEINVATLAIEMAQPAMALAVITSELPPSLDLDGVSGQTGKAVEAPSGLVSPGPRPDASEVPLAPEQTLKSEVAVVQEKLDNAIKIQHKAVTWLQRSLNEKELFKDRLDKSLACEKILKAQIMQLKLELNRALGATEGGNAF